MCFKGGRKCWSTWRKTLEAQGETQLMLVGNPQKVHTRFGLAFSMLGSTDGQAVCSLCLSHTEKAGGGLLDWGVQETFIP